MEWEFSADRVVHAKVDCALSEFRREAGMPLEAALDTVAGSYAKVTAVPFAI